MKTLAPSSSRGANADYRNGRVMTDWTPPHSDEQDEGLLMALRDGLVSYWKLDEASGVRADRRGSNDLTPVGTVGATAAVKSNGAQVLLADAGSYLQCAAPVGLQFTGSYTVAFWAYIYSLSTIGQYRDCVNYFVVNGDIMGFQAKAAFNADMAWITGWGSAWLITHAPYLANTWTCFIAWVDAENRNIDIVSSRDGFVSNVSAASEGMEVTPCGNETPLIVGGLSTAFGHGDHVIDEIGIWDRVLTSDERAEYYNGGAGWTYAKTVMVRRTA